MEVGGLGPETMGHLETEEEPKGPKTLVVVAEQDRRRVTGGPKPEARQAPEGAWVHPALRATGRGRALPCAQHPDTGPGGSGRRGRGPAPWDGTRLAPLP